jgi:hypothetical protein
VKERDSPDDSKADRSLLSSRRASQTKERHDVGMVLVLFQISDEEPRLDPGALVELAALGITSVSLLRDEQTAGLVLEGWAFDPDRADEAVRAAAGAPDGIRMLEPLVHMAVSAASSGGRARTEEELR